MEKGFKEQTKLFEQQAIWLSREYLKLIKKNSSATTRHKARELSLRTSQLRRDYDRFLEQYNLQQL
jgi:hypothetical protein